MLRCGKLGPAWTIAKVKRERKEKSQKRLEKCDFFGRHVEITAKTAGRTHALVLQVQGRTL